jgi:hypothetical protein
MCNSKTLSFFNVAVATRDFKTWNISHLKIWDEILFPSLSLNAYRNRMGVRAPQGVAALAIKAVNKGRFYRETTHHAPFDMSSANAGLIFHIVKVNPT